MKMFEWKDDPVVMPLTQAFPELNQVREFRSRQCIFSSDRKQVYAVTGKNYQPVPNRVLIDSVEKSIKELDLGSHKRNIVTVNSGARMLAEYRFPSITATPQVGDIVHFALRIANSYDLSWKLDIRLAAHQLVCKNGAVLGREFGSIATKHYKGLIDGDLKVLTNGLGSMLGSVSKIQKKWKSWSSIMVTAEVATAKLNANPWVPKKHMDYIMGGVFPCSLWELYCRFTYAATHMTASINRRVELDEQVSKLFYTEG
jgi:hypothetical protein